MTTTAPIRLFTFPAAFGLPTSGPFGLKLELLLRILDVPYERVYELDNRKGPKRKSPWIEDGSVRMGDSELILEHIARTRGQKLDEGRTPEERARGHVLRAMLEERFHQVFEYELLAHPKAFGLAKALAAQMVPGFLAGVAATMFVRSIRKHLFERGVARHTDEEIAAMGRADVDALVAWLGDREWFVSDHPTRADAIAFGLLAVGIRCGNDTPTFEYLRQQPTLVAFVDRVIARYFPELAKGERPAAPASKSAKNGAADARAA